MRRFYRRGIAGTLVVVIAGSLLIAATAPSDDIPERSEPLEWGMYQILRSRRYGERVTRTLTKFASPPSYVMFYHDLGRPFPRRQIESVAEVGATTSISLELWRWGRGRDKTERFLPRINAGEFDAHFRQWAVDAKAYGGRVLLRFGFEMNGDWFSWSHDPKGFVTAWRRAHDIFTEVGADKVEWVWAPNFVSCPDTRANNMHRYYPGDEYVDWVAIDGYNFGDHHDEWHEWDTFDECLEKQLKDFAKRYPHKPMMLAEFGCAIGKPGQRAKWIRDAYRSLQRFPQVKAAIWFNYDKTREGEPNFRIDNDPESLRAFNETFARPRPDTEKK